MGNPRSKVCVVTGSRAEYSLLYWLLRRLEADQEIDLQLVVTGAHLAPEFGLTYKIIEADGFAISDKVEMLLASDSRVATAKSLALATAGLADSFSRLQPDLIVLCGDRYEMLAAAQAALVLAIPVAHIAGGDVTEGAFDEAIRHSITKMSHLHFVTNDSAARRVRQLGENPDSIFTVGSPALEHLKNVEWADREQLERELGIKFRRHNVLVTFHPETLGSSSNDQLAELLSALESLGESCTIIFTGVNADPGSRKLRAQVQEFVSRNTNASLFTNLGQRLYLSLMRTVDVVVGNSSSGLYEAPSFKVPTVNIGDRQAGRERAMSVIDCVPRAADIAKAISAALERDWSSTVNPYEREHTVQQIIAQIKRFLSGERSVKKKFFDLE
jgi:UDP-N-acetylglucosamine 2-epimerase (non-hydrolysing)/GDP/UDP-N,N'-diacetylbacillosamine 2-epimerase (hydrolysing)